MHRSRLVLLAGTALFLAACDQVRLPGLDGPAADKSAQPGPGSYTEQDLLPADAGTELAAEAEQAPEAPPELAPELASELAPDLAAGAAQEGALPETTGADEAESGEGDSSEDAPADGASDEAGLAVNPEAAMAMTLDLVNASRCALPDGAAPTPTVAMAANALDIEEPMMGAEAVNALAASLSAFPGVVKLEPRRTEPTGAIVSGHCGAVRIAPGWLATAAHCVDQPYDEIRLIGEAESLRSPDAKRASAAFAVCHAGYRGTENGYANDIALIRMDEAQLETFANVPVARRGATERPLAPANYPTGEMAGWGVTRFDGQLSNDLLMTRVKITAAGPATITVASDNGAGPCIGDSGGPLYVAEADGSKTVIGILSVVEQNRTTGHFCVGDYNGRYTNLQGYSDWITDVIALCESDEAACR